MTNLRMHPAFGYTLLGCVYFKIMYNYQAEKSKIFTEDGQETFLKIRDKVQHLLKQSGAVMMQNAISGVTGDSWLHLACVDRLVELKEIIEITKENVAGQHRVFVAVS